MTEAPLLKLEEICRQQKVMLVIARSYGLAGLVRISVMVRKPWDGYFILARIHCGLSFSLNSRNSTVVV